MASLAEEMDSLKRGNASLAREIQARKETLINEDEKVGELPTGRFFLGFL